MNSLHKGLILAGAHLAIVLSLGGKLLYDRATRPRAWVKTAPVDPDLPIRGRYVSLEAEVPVTGVELPPARPRPSHLKSSDPWPPRWERYGVQVELSVEPNGLTARPERPGARTWDYNSNAFLPESLRSRLKEQWSVVLREPIPYFIPEHAQDPSRRAPDEELWVEVTLPKKGPLRPIRLGVKKHGVLTPLDL